MHKKTIVMIGNTSWGMFHFRAETIKVFVSKGHKVFVLAPHDEFSHRFAELKCEFVPFALDRKGTNPLSEISSIFNLTAILLKIKPDIVLSYTIKPVLYGTIAAKIANVKKIIAITTGLGFVFSHNTITSKIAKILYKLILKFANEIWFLNQEDKNIFINSNLIPEHKSFVLPGEGVDTEFYKSCSLNDDKIVFTLISRMLWDKGVGIFFEAAERIKNKYPSVEFQILGPIDEGNPEGISLRQLRDWNDKGSIKYLGAMNDIRPILNKTTCLIHPTYYKEGLPRILIEACSMNVPCITTDTPGCRDVIQDSKNGFLIIPRDVNSLVEAIEKFLGLSIQSRKELSKFSREMVVENFSSTVVSDIYLSRIGL